MANDRPDPGEFLEMAQRMLRDLFGGSSGGSSGEDEPWSEATRPGRESFSKERHHEPSRPRAGTADRTPARSPEHTAQVTFACSAAIVVSSPCPVCTTVSPGRVSSLVLIDSTIVGRSLKLRPVAPGPPRKSVSPVKTAPRSGAYRQLLPGE